MITKWPEAIFRPPEDMQNAPAWGRLPATRRWPNRARGHLPATGRDIKSTRTVAKTAANRILKFFFARFVCQTLTRDFGVSSLSRELGQKLPTNTKNVSACKKCQIQLPPRPPFSRCILFAMNSERFWIQVRNSVNKQTHGL